MTKNSENQQSSARTKGLCVCQYLGGQEVSWAHLGEHGPEHWVKGVGLLPAYVSSESTC